MSGCDYLSSDVRDNVLNADGESRDQLLNADGGFGVFWPPRDLHRSQRETDAPLLNGELSVFEAESDPLNAFRMRITLRRPDGEMDRVRWNENLAFPEYSWMAQVRVWDRDRKWLWPNLPFLLRAHGEERVERYGGVDPGKGIDNDFAAVLIRPLEHTPPRTENRPPTRSTQPLVSAEWYSDDAENLDKNSVVHIARSDDFGVRLLPSDGQTQSGKLGIWLIFADFLGASAPRNWPTKGEYAGGILAYFEVYWQRSSDGDFEFDIKHLIPPTDTGFDWAGWSTGSSPLKKHLEMINPRQISE